MNLSKVSLMHLFMIGVSIFGITYDLKTKTYGIINYISMKELFDGFYCINEHHDYKTRLRNQDRTHPYSYFMAKFF